LEVGFEGRKWEYGEWSCELGTAKAGWFAFGEWELTAAAWGERDEGGDVNIYVSWVEKYYNSSTPSGSVFVRSNN
jgi:hypothetical protein